VRFLRADARRFAGELAPLAARRISFDLLLSHGRCNIFKTTVQAADRRHRDGDDKAMPPTMRPPKATAVGAPAYSAMAPEIKPPMGMSSQASPWMPMTRRAVHWAGSSADGVNRGHVELPGHANEAAMSESGNQLDIANKISVTPKITAPLMPQSFAKWLK
jgi:hypothetical protein